MKVVGLQGDRLQLLVGDLDASGVVALIEAGFDGEARAGRGRSDQIDDDLVAGEWMTPPVHRDVAPQPVLHLCSTSTSRVGSDRP